MSVATTAATEADIEPEPEREITPEEKYNSQVDFVGAHVEVLPLYDRVVPGFVNRLPVLFQFVTGRDPHLCRDAFSLVVVLDVSGSMSGSKLASCKKAILQLIDTTGDDDILSLVTYDDCVNIVFEGIRCGSQNGRQNMKDQVLAVQSGGGTDLYGGLLAGYSLLQRQEDAANKHIFLLSDGETNSGLVQKTDDILKAVAAWDEKIPILSYGIGDGFNERLMSPLGQVHRGSHYFYITDAASIEKLIARGVRALTGAVAREVCLQVRPMSRGVWFPDHMIEGNSFALIRERSVLQFLVELEVRPEFLESPAQASYSTGRNLGWTCARRRAERMSDDAGVHGLQFSWQVQGFPLLVQSSGTVTLVSSSFRGQKNAEVQAFLDTRRGCELRRMATGSPEARKMCEEALQLFEGCIGHDRFGFAQEWADKTKALLDDRSLWRGNSACDAAAKHLGIHYAAKGAVEEEEEEEMDFDLFG